MIRQRVSPYVPPRGAVGISPRTSPGTPLGPAAPTQRQRAQQQRAQQQFALIQQAEERMVREQQAHARVRREQERMVREQQAQERGGRANRPAEGGGFWHHHG